MASIAALSSLKEILEAPSWLQMKQISNDHGDLLNIFFSSYLAPDHAKWYRIQDLNDQINIDRHNSDLWLQRAILYLQCGVGLYADSDAKEGLKLKKQGLLPADKESSFHIVIMLASLQLHRTGDSHSPAVTWFHALTSLYPISHRIDIIYELNFVFTSSLFQYDPSPHPDVQYIPCNKDLNWIFYPGMRRIQSCVEGMVPCFRNNSLSPVASAYAIALFKCLNDAFEDYLITYTEAATIKVTTLMQRFNATPLNVAKANRGQYFIPLFYGRRNPTEVVQWLKANRNSLMRSVDVIECPEKGGLKMIAKEAINAGELLFIETPFCSFRAAEANAGSVCAECWCTVNPRNVPYRCSSCPDLYCSAACRQHAENDGHHHLCSSEWTNFCRSILSQDVGRQNYMVEIFGMSFKLYALAKQRGLSTVFELDEFKMLRSRQDANNPSEHLQLMKCNTDVGGVALSLEVFSRRYPNLFSMISASDMYTIYNFTMCNTTGSSGRGLGNKGTYASLYLLMSFMNNDCANPAADYTAPIVNGKQQLYVTAKRNIKAGEEITCRYNFNSNDHDRKIVLRDTYRFFCECAKCKNIKIGEFGENWG